MTTSGYHIRDIVEEAQVRWLKPGEVFFILQNYEEKQLTHKPPQKPPSGSLFLFDRKVLRFFRKDGHNWRRKKDGITLGEAHERLKVGNIEALNCYYAHGEQNPSFQRRSYWMLNSEIEHIVLVHYRDTTIGRNIGGPHSAVSPGSPSTLVQSSTSYASQLTRSSAAAASSEIGEPYESNSSPNCIEVSSDRVTEGISDSPNSGIDQALRKIEEQLSLDEDQLKNIDGFYTENDNSYDSGLTADEQNYNLFRGFQDHSQRLHSSQQTSFWKDMLTCDGSSKNDSSMLLPNELEDSKFSSYTPARNMHENDPDFYSAKFDQEHVQMPFEPDSSLTITQEQKFTIREISPEWGYATESTKVHIIGTFPSDPSKCEFTCMFGDTEIPIKIIQEGVICCQAPPHLPGKVTVFITSRNKKSCSEIREFEYRDKPSSYIHTNSTEKESCRSLEEQLLLVRLVQLLLSDQITQKQENTRIDEDSWGQVIEAILDGSLTSSSATDWVLVQLVKDKLHHFLFSRSQDINSFSSALSKREQGIIHMISGLGFWWALSPILNSGVSVNFRDINGWTALHWAARFGREKMVAQLLASGAFAGAVTDPSNQDPSGKTAASIAFTHGHKGLAGYLSEISLTSHLSSLTLQESQLSKTSANIEAERTVNSISNANLVTNEDRISLKDTLCAVRNATQAAARIQSAFRAHSFKKRQQKEFDEYATEEDEYGILSSEIEGLSAASKLAFGKSNDHYAALSIQKKYRGWKGRKDFVSLRQNVVKIQAHVRGHQVRKSYKVICWAVGMVEKIILRWRRKGAGLRGFHQELVSADDKDEGDDVVKAFRKQKVDVAVGEAVSRVLSMVDSQPARQQYSRMLENHRQAKAECGGFGGDATNMEKDDFY